MENINAPLRTFLVNSSSANETDSDGNKQKFPSNAIKTAKYNIITFLPLALLYQFTNYFNIYFLIVTIILAIKVISGMDPGFGLGPFCFVIGISLLIEFAEFWKRANYDKTYNNSLTLVYNDHEKKFVSKKWKDIAVGNILKLLKNQPIPADILVVKSAAANGLCYLDTVNLDGESALKPREALHVLSKDVPECKEVENNDISFPWLEDGKSVSIEVDPPNQNIYRIDGSVKINTNAQKFYYSIDNVLLRGGSLKNAHYVYGIVVYTGKDTKIMQNINNQNYKLSSIEKQVNKIIIFVIILTFIICIACTLAGEFVDLSMYDKGTFYLFSSDTSKVPDKVVDSFKVFGAYFIIFNNVIPICLMITMQIVKAAQLFLISMDTKLIESNDDKLTIHSFRLHEDLGNIRYIFSDKTGTLTKNEMLFKACSIFTKLYSNENLNLNFKDGNGNNNTNNNNINTSINLFNERQPKSFFEENFDKQELIDAFNDFSKPNILDLDNTPFESISEVTKYFFLNVILNHSVLAEFEKNENENEKDKPVMNNINNNIPPEVEINDDESDTEVRRNNYTRPKLICKQVFPKRIFQGSNPDELTLVQAANELGVEYIERVGDVITICYFGEVKVYKVLHRFEFTSARLRSSIMVKEIKLPQKEGEEGIYSNASPADPRIFLFMKGADNVILAQQSLDSYSLNFTLKRTKEHVDKFAKAGYRTLCYSMKVVEPEEFAGFDQEFSTAKDRALNNRRLAGDLEKVIANLETNMTLLGVTSLEDKLQDNVKNDIHDFLEAGIHVWMLTGDKLDTAESIAYSCKLFNEDTEVFKIKADPVNIEKLKETLTTILRKMEKSEDELTLLNMERRQRKINKIKRELKFSPEEVQDKNIFSLIRHKLPTNANEKLFVGKNLKNLNIPPGENFNNQINGGKAKTILSFTNGANITNQKPNEKIKSTLIQSIDKKLLQYARPISSRQRNFITQPILVNIEDKNNNNNNNNFLLSPRNLLPWGGDQLHGRRSSIACNEYPHNPRFCDPFSFEDVADKEVGRSLCNEEEINDVSIIRFMQDKKEYNDNSMNSILNNIVGKHNTQDLLILPENLNKNIYDPPKVPPSDNPFPKSSKFNSMNLNEMRNYYYNQIEEIEQKKSGGFMFYKSKEKNINTSGIKEDNNSISLHAYNHHHGRDYLKNFGLIIEGFTITKCMQQDLDDIFLRIIHKCRSVVCCRCAPIQKSAVVNFVKRKTDVEKNSGVTLAIGDGGNDVNMITCADIGIGIFGKEGHQAASSSDYAIGQFKYLKRLLFYHGRFCLVRNSYFIFYFFYKSIIYCFPNLWFIFFSAYSGLMMYDDFYYLLYNAFISNIIVSTRAMVEEDIDMNFEDFPKTNTVTQLSQDIYREVRDKQPFSKVKFFLVFIFSIVHSLFIFFVPMCAYRMTIFNSEGHIACYWMNSITVFFTIIIYQTVILIQDTFYWNFFTVFGLSLHILLNILVVIIRNFSGFDQLGGCTFEIIGTCQFVFTVILSCAMSLYPYMFYRGVENFFFDDIVNNLRYEKYEHDIDKKLYLKKLEQVNKVRRILAKFKKLYNSDDNFEAENYPDKRMKDLVNMYKSSKKRKNSDEDHQKKSSKDNDRLMTINIYNNQIINNINALNPMDNQAIIYDFPEDLLNNDDQLDNY